MMMGGVVECLSWPGNGVASQITGRVMLDMTAAAFTMLLKKIRGAASTYLSVIFLAGHLNTLGSPRP